MEESEEKINYHILVLRMNSFLKKRLFGMGLKNKLNFNYHMDIWEEEGNVKKDKHESVFRKVLPF